MKFRGLGESRGLAQGLYRQVYTGYIPVYTGIYCVYCGIDLSRDCTNWYIPVYTMYRLMYRLVYTGIYRYIPVCTEYIPVYTSLYKLSKMVA